jgi:hypothetical protein
MKKTTICYIAVWCVCFVLLVLLFLFFNLHQLDIAFMLCTICMILTLILSLAQLIFMLVRYLMKFSQISFVRYWRHLFIYVFLSFFFGFQTIPLVEIMDKKAREEIINSIKQMNASKITIIINGRETKQKSVILGALRQLQSMENKGGRLPVVQCEISDGEKKLVLILSRNNISRDHLYDYSYLVYYPKYHMTKGNNPIGGFYSKSLDLESP